MHGQARERLNVDVPVVERVDVAVERADVDKAMREVEVRAPEERDERGPERETRRVPPVGQDVAVREVRELAGRVEVPKARAISNEREDFSNAGILYT